MRRGVKVTDNKSQITKHVELVVGDETLDVFVKNIAHSERASFFAGDFAWFARIEMILSGLFLHDFLVLGYLEPF